MKKMKKGRPVVLADRDGTLIRDVPYLSRIEDIALLPGVAEAIRDLNRLGIPVALVTNQSGVARGYFPESFVLESHSRLMELLAEEGATLQGLYYCPHLPPEGEPSEADPALSRYRRVCGCRKPGPDLILRALADLGGDPARSVVIGDADRDLEAGEAAGCAQGYRILGEGRESALHPSLHVASFAEGVEHFLAFLEKGGSSRED
jgi:D-glycero-D-manno-heptose 1,7-bisphosphate phosphatase